MGVNSQSPSLQNVNKENFQLFVNGKVNSPLALCICRSHLIKGKHTQPGFLLERGKSLSTVHPTFLPELFHTF